jgi:hypothetical protein
MLQMQYLSNSSDRLPFVRNRLLEFALISEDINRLLEYPEEYDKSRCMYSYTDLILAPLPRQQPTTITMGLWIIHHYCITIYHHNYSHHRDPYVRPLLRTKNPPVVQDYRERNEWGYSAILFFRFSKKIKGEGIIIPFLDLFFCTVVRTFLRRLPWYNRY